MTYKEAVENLQKYVDETLPEDKAFSRRKKEPS